jgi:DNA invertase Pin-like site-specific DNA recombinase
MSLYSKIFTKEVLEKAFAEHGSLKAVGRHYGVDATTIKRYMQSYGLKTPEPVRYNCDHQFFSRDTEESFYVAGFIAADGCVKNNYTILDIGLAKKDEAQLQMIKDLLKAENPLHYKISKNSRANPNWKDTEAVEMRITSKQMCQDLLRFGITERKTHTLKFPEWILNHPLKHHFIRGYFDGDGSFYTYLKNDGSRTVEQVFFSVRGTKDFLSGIVQIFDEECNLPAKSKSKVPRLSSGINTLDYGGNRILQNIVEFIYKDATIYMDRKYQIGIKAKSLGDPRDFEEICNKEAIQSLYDKFQSLEKVAKELGVNLTTVHNYAHKHGIQINESTGSKNARFQSELTEEVLLKALKDAGSVKGAARELKIGATTMKRFRDNYGIPVT